MKLYLRLNSRSVFGENGSTLNMVSKYLGPDLSIMTGLLGAAPMIDI